jgi:hypothetical protein
MDCCTGAPRNALRAPFTVPGFGYSVLGSGTPRQVPGFGYSVLGSGTRPNSWEQSTLVREGLACQLEITESPKPGTTCSRHHLLGTTCSLDHLGGNEARESLDPPHRGRRPPQGELSL